MCSCSGRTTAANNFDRSCSSSAHCEEDEGAGGDRDTEDVEDEKVGLHRRVVQHLQFRLQKNGIPVHFYGRQEIAMR